MHVPHHYSRFFKKRVLLKFGILIMFFFVLCPILTKLSQIAVLMSTVIGQDWIENKNVYITKQNLSRTPFLKKRASSVSMY